MKYYLVLLLILLGLNLFGQSLRLQYRVDRIPVNSHGFPETSYETVTIKWRGDLTIVESAKDTLILTFYQRTFQGDNLYKQGEQIYWIEGVHSKNYGIRIWIVPLKPYFSESLYSLNLSYGKDTNITTVDSAFITKGSN
jgi:hypothetical protein